MIIFPIPFNGFLKGITMAHFRTEPYGYKVKPDILLDYFGMSCFYLFGVYYLSSYINILYIYMQYTYSIEFGL